MKSKRGKTSKDAEKRTKSMNLTQAHDDTVAVSLGMLHEIVGQRPKIMHHLHGFGVLQDEIFPFNTTLIEVIVNQLPDRSPLLTVAHDERVIAACDEIVGDIGRWPIAIDGTLFIDEGFHQFSVGDHHGRCRA